MIDPALSMIVPSKACGSQSMMHVVVVVSAVMLLIVIAAPAHSRDDKYLLPIKAALESAEPRQKPDGSVKFFFGKASTPPVASKLGSVTPHGKAHTRRTEDVKACNLAFVAALMEFEKHAKQAGANAVVNVVSYYKNVEMASATEFECHAGAAAHAVLRGDLAKLAD